MKNINFRPWVGAKYSTEGFQGKKILVLGESHYCQKELDKDGVCFPICKLKNMSADCFSQTEDVISNFVYNYEGESFQQTFLCFERAVMGKELTKQERENFWNSIIFYNYIQYSQSGPRSKPMEEQCQSSEKAFHDLLEEYMPDYIIVWGVRLYNNLPNWNGTHSILSISENESTDIWTYDINGKSIPAMKVFHPSTPIGKAWGHWHKFYIKFLNIV